MEEVFTQIRESICVTQVFGKKLQKFHIQWDMSICLAKKVVNNDNFQTWLDIWKQMED